MEKDDIVSGYMYDFVFQIKQVVSHKLCGLSLRLDKFMLEI